MHRKFLCVLVLLLCVFAVQAEAAVNSPIRIGMLKFLSRTKDVSEDQAAAVGDVLARMITNSKTVSILEREQLGLIASEHQMSLSGAVTDDTALNIGRIAGCQYMMFGAVTRYEQSVSTTDLWLWGTRKFFALATIDVRIVNVETTEVMLSLSETGTTSQKGTKFNFYGMNSQKEMDFRGLEAGAIADAASRLSYKILYALTGESSQVLKTTKKDVTISTGATSGAQLGGLYRVYMEGEIIKDADGKFLGRRMNNLAVVKIVDVQRDFSIAHIADKKAGSLANIKRGDKIYPVTQTEMKDMIQRKAFPAKRPKEVKLTEEEKKFLEGGV